MTRTFNVLDPHERVGGIHFLEASAGTGKTFTLTHVVIRLLFETEFNIPFSKIAVVTFTRAARAELKKRIKALLLELESNPLPLKRIFKNDHEAGLKINAALEAFDEAPIFTIHGLCFALLQKIAPKLGLILDGKNPEEISLDELAYNTIKNCLSDSALDLVLCQTEKKALLGAHQRQFHELIKSVRQKVLSGLQVEPLETWEELEKNLNLALSHLPSYPGNEALSESLKPYKLSPLTQEDVNLQIDTLGKVLAHEMPIESLLFKKSFLELFDDRNLKKNKIAPVGSMAVSFIETAKKGLLPLLQKGMMGERIELLFVHFCTDAFEKVLKEKKLFSFQSLLNTLDKALDNSQIQTQLAGEFEALIVDEFQDTDPIQWSIFKKLVTQCGIKTFYMIGDPKQAIYAFRAADVYTYLEAKTELSHTQTSHLDTSYRSEIPLLTSLNAFFSQFDWLELPYIDKKEPYHPVHAGSKIISHLDHAPFVFYPIPQSPEDGELSMGNLALELLHVYPKDTVAILLKDRFQAARMEHFLTQKGQKYFSLKNETLDESLIMECLETFLLLFEENFSQASVHRFLLSGWFNYTLGDFAHEQALYETTTPLLQDLEIIFYEKGLLASLEYSFDLTWPLHEQTHRFIWSSWYGPGVIDILFYIASILDEKHLKLPSLFLLELAHLKKANPTLPQIQDQKAPLTLMTTHLSKGLEFDHVIALGTSTRSARAPQILVKRKGHQLYYGLNTQDVQSKKSLHDLDAEKLRQLYVALTRAKKSIHVPLLDYSGESLKLGLLSPLEFFLIRLHYPEASYEELYEKLHTDSFENLAHLVAAKFSGSGFDIKQAPTDSLTLTSTITCPYLNKSLPTPTCSETRSLSFSSIKTKSYSGVQNQEILKGKDYGDFFHKLMQTILELGLFKEPLESKSYDEIREKIAYSIYQDHENQIFHHIQNALNAVFSFHGKTFMLEDLNPQSVWVEEAFMYGAPEGIVRGFIDAIFVYEDHLFFLDWKTSFLTATDPQSLLKHMEETEYLLQLDLYKTALEKRLSFFKAKALGAAFYVFVKSSSVYTESFEEVSQ